MRSVGPDFQGGIADQAAFIVAIVGDVIKKGNAVFLGILQSAADIGDVFAEDGVEELAVAVLRCSVGGGIISPAVAGVADESDGSVFDGSPFFRNGVVAGDGEFGSAVIPGIAVAALAEDDIVIMIDTVVGAIVVVNIAAADFQGIGIIGVAQVVHQLRAFVQTGD